MHVLRQEETLCQAPGNSPTFTLRPGFNTSYHRKRLIFKLEGGLPAYFWPKGARHIRPNLGNWPSVTSKLSDCNPARHLGRWGSRGSTTLDPGWLFGSALPFSGAARKRRRGSWASSLGLLLLCWWTSARQKTVDDHYSSNHYFVLTLIGFCFWGIYWLGCCLLDWLNLGLSLRFFNGSMGDAVLGNYLCWSISERY